MPPKYKYKDDWNNWNTTAWGGTTTFTSPTITYEAPPKRRPIRDWFRNLGLRLASERGGTALPMMGGGAPDAETLRETEHKKKITLKREVGVPRDKGAGVEQIHKGSVTLVRTVEGDVAQTGTIGIATKPHSGNYVEIPVADLVAAVEELRDEPIKNP